MKINKKELKVDITRLRTIANYAKMQGLTTVRIYQLEKEDKIKVLKIDGVKFVKLD